MTKLEKLQALLAATLVKMETLNNENATMDDTQTQAFADLQAKYDSTQRAIKLEGMNNVLSAQVDDVIVAKDSMLSTAAAEYKDGFDKFLQARTSFEAQAAMTEGVNEDGGYTVPETYQNTVVMKLNALSETRKISTVIGTTSTTNIPTSGNIPEFAWIDETGEYPETNTTFGNKTLSAYKLGGVIPVSRELLQDTAINFDSYMANQIALGLDRVESQSLCIGNGVKKPTGYQYGAAVGTHSTTASTTAITADEIIDMFYDLKGEYRKSATWRMNDSTLKAIDKLKDTDGSYLLGSLADGLTPTIKGRPVVVDNNMPEMGAGNKFVVFGDFASYQIADRGTMTIQRLEEALYKNGMVGFQVTVRVDAKIITEEAFNAGQNAAE